MAVLIVNIHPHLVVVTPRGCDTGDPPRALDNMTPLAVLIFVTTPLPLEPLDYFYYYISHILSLSFLPLSFILIHRPSILTHRHYSSPSIPAPPRHGRSQRRPPPSPPLTNHPPPPLSHTLSPPPPPFSHTPLPLSLPLTHHPSSLPDMVAHNAANEAGFLAVLSLAQMAVSPHQSTQASVGRQTTSSPPILTSPALP